MSSVFNWKKKKEKHSPTGRVYDPHLQAYIVAVARLCGTDRDPALAPLHPKEKKRRAVANVQDHPLPVAEYLEKKTAV